MCEISGEKCACKVVTMTTEMSCLEKSLTRTILNLNEIFISENVTILNIKIENKIYDGINKSSYGKFQVNIKELWINNNQIKKLESNSFQDSTNLAKMYLISNGIENIEKNTFSGLFFLQYLYLYDNKLKCIKNETFNNLVNLIVLSLHQNRYKKIHFLVQ